MLQRLAAVEALRHRRSAYRRAVPLLSTSVARRLRPSWHSWAVGGCDIGREKLASDACMGRLTSLSRGHQATDAGTTPRGTKRNTVRRSEQLLHARRREGHRFYWRRCRREPPHANGDGRLRQLHYARRDEKDSETLTLAAAGPRQHRASARLRNVKPQNTTMVRILSTRRVLGDAALFLLRKTYKLLFVGAFTSPCMALRLPQAPHSVCGAPGSRSQWRPSAVGG